MSGRPLRARVEIALRDGVFDPEAAAILRALGGLGVGTVRAVRRTRVFELELEAAEPAAAEGQVRSMCERLLANPVIETFKVSLDE